jgi:hypothetical protein
MKRTTPVLVMACTVLSLVAAPAHGAKPAKHYASPEATCVWGDRTEYAPHSYAVCSESSVDYTAVTRAGQVTISGKGITEFTFDAGVYHSDHLLEYDFAFITRPGNRGTHHLQESATYKPHPDFTVTCTFTIDLQFSHGVLVKETATNVCP